MACTTIFDGFREITEWLNSELYRRASIQSGSGWWLTGIERGVYPLNVGTSATETVTMANSEPTYDTPAFQAESGRVDDVNDGHCDLTYAATENGFDVRNYGPEKYGLKGPLLCRDEFPFVHNVDATLNAYLEELNKHKTRVLVNRLQEHYISYSTKYIANANFNSYVGTSLAATTGAATLPSELATSELTKGMLSRVAQDEIYAGGTNPDSKGFVSLGADGPLFSLLIHPSMSEKLLTNNSNLRNDIRYAEPSELMKRWGATRTFFNFRLIPNLLPPRYNHDGTNYVRVNTFENVSATGKGVKSQISTDYKNARYEAAILIHPNVIKIEFVQPKNRAGQVAFNPTNYMFEWSWAQGAWKLGLTCEDPTEKYGRHYAELRWAIKPVFPEYGRVIIYKRCDDSVETVTCPDIS